MRHESYPNPETKHYLDLASEELARITQITGQLLTFHREAQSPVQVDLAKVLESVLTLLRSADQHERHNRHFPLRHAASGARVSG